MRKWASVTGRPIVSVPGPVRSNAAWRTWSITAGLLKSLTAASRAARRVTSCKVFSKYIARATSMTAHSSVKNSSDSRLNSTVIAPRRRARAGLVADIAHGCGRAQRQAARAQQVVGIKRQHVVLQQVGHLHRDRGWDEVAGTLAAVAADADQGRGAAGAAAVEFGHDDGARGGHHLRAAGRRLQVDLGAGGQVARGVVAGALHDLVVIQGAAEKQRQRQQQCKGRQDQRHFHGGDAARPAGRGGPAHGSSSTAPPSAWSCSAPANSVLRLVAVAGAVMKKRPTASTLALTVAPAASGQASSATLSTRRWRRPGRLAADGAW